MKLGTLIAAFVAAALLVASGRSTARAQDAEDPAVAETERAEAAAPEVIEAWTVPAGDAARVSADDTVESDAFARIHDADAELLELQEAERLVGFDLLDGVR